MPFRRRYVHSHASSSTTVSSRTPVQSSPDALHRSSPHTSPSTHIRETSIARRNVSSQPSGSSHPMSGSSRRIIQLLDTSESESDSESDAAPQSEVATPPLPDGFGPGSDGILTPELPTAASLLHPPTFELPPPRVSPPHTPSVHADDADVEAYAASSPASPAPPASPPQAPPDPLANQRPLFDPEELQMQPLYDELKVLLDSEIHPDQDDDDEDYEQRRQRKLRANEALLAQLGLSATTTKLDANKVAASTDDLDGDDDHHGADHVDQTPSRPRGRPRKRPRSKDRSPDPHFTHSKKKKYDRKVKFADDGTTKAAPLAGESFILAYIDVPTLRDRARNDYMFIRDVPEIRPEDRDRWSEADEADEADQDLADDDGLEAPLDSTDAKPGEGRKRRNRQPDVLPDGTELSSCHQCRRKTADAKMRCQRVRKGVQCPLCFCHRCLTIRYENVFDPTNASFHCPRCQGYCNCSICLRRSGFGDLVQKGRQTVLAFSEQLKKLAAHDGLDDLQGRIESILAESQSLASATPSRKKPSKHQGSDGGPQVSKAPRRRGRPPKDGDEVEAEPVVLSSEVGPDEVFSPLEEHALGRLAVARHVLKLVAAKRGVPSRKRLVVRLTKPPARPGPALSGQPPEAGGGTARRTSNYQDVEKDVWVRSAADYSTSESEEDELVDEDEDEDTTHADFEEGRVHAFASSHCLERQRSGGSLGSMDGSSLTSLGASPSGSSCVASFESDRARSGSWRADSADSATDADGFASFGAEPVAEAVVAGAHDMQQFARVVLDEPSMPTKSAHDALGPPLGDELSALASSMDAGGGLGELRGLLEPEQSHVLPPLLADPNFGDLDPVHS